MRRILTLVCLTLSISVSKAQYLNKLEITPTFSVLSYTPHRDVINRGVEHHQRAEYLSPHVGLKASYRLKYFDIGYGFGYNIGSESNIRNTKDGQEIGFGTQNLQWFSNALGAYVYPLGNKGKIKTYLYFGGIFYISEITTNEFFNSYTIENPLGTEVASGIVQWTNPARSAGFIALGIEANVGIKYLVNEHFGFNLSIGTNSFQSNIPRDLPKHLQIYQVEVGLIFRTLKTKLPL